VSAARMSMRSVVEGGICQRGLQLDYDEEVHHAAVQKLYDLARQPERRPFFVTVSYTHPHNPFITTDKYWNLYRDSEIDRPHVPPIPLEQKDPHSQRHYWLTGMDEFEIRDEHIQASRHAYYGMVSYVDEKVGELMTILRETGLDENTLVVFTADHGEMLGERGMWYKMTLFEGAMRIPFLFSGPGVARGKRVEQPVSLVDLAPTLLELAEVAPSSLADEMDGSSLLPVLGGDSAEQRDVYAEYTAEGAISPCLMIRRGSYKYIWSKPDGAQLFDLANDPHELKNLSGSSAYADVERELHDRLHQVWDDREMYKRVIDSQRRRHFLQPILMSGERSPWDYQAHTDGSKKYVRSGDSPTATKAKFRFPYVAPGGSKTT
jgi:choline-sulfatase